jgi:DNA-binding MarR family transcriptional regulator
MTRAVLVPLALPAQRAVGSREISSALRELVAEAMMFHHATARRHRLTFLQLLLLRSIETKGPMAPSEVAAHFGISRPAVTASLNLLEEGGWIARTHRPGDRRRLQTSLRPPAVQLLRRIDRERERLLEDGLASIPRAERAGYLRITRRLIDGLRSRQAPHVRGGRP